MSKHFIIIFLGLISHFGLQNGDVKFERAALTRFEHHTPVLFLRDIDIEKAPNHFPLKRLKECPPVARTKCYDLTGVHLEVRGLPAGPLDSVDSHLPRLTRITNGVNPEPEVVNARSFKYAFAYVDYMGGSLKVPQLNTPAIYWRPAPSAPKCNPSGEGGPYFVPRYTAHDSIPTGKVVVLYVAEGPAVNPAAPPSMRQITLKANSTITIANLSPAMPGPDHPPDYQEHLWLLDDGDCMLKMERSRENPRQGDANARSSDGKLDLAGRHFTDHLTIAELVDRLSKRYSLEVECGQSQNPPPP